MKPAVSSSRKTKILPEPIQPDEVPVEAIRRCPTCEQPAPDKFCSTCGEQILDRPDYSFRGLLGETLNVVANLESNIFRSFKLLVTKPGLLTVEYFLGRRKRYLKPLQLFIFCNVIFFFFQALTDFNSLRTPLRVHLSQLPHTQLAQQLVRKELQTSGVKYPEYEARFNASIETQAKTLVFLMIPIFAFGLWLLYLRRGEYFVKHLVFSTHFFAFYLLLLSALYFLIRMSIRLWLQLGDNFDDLTVTTIVLSCCLIYLILAIRRTYDESWKMSVVKGLALIVTLMVAVQSFRAILFFTTFYTV